MNVRSLAPATLLGLGLGLGLPLAACGDNVGLAAPDAAPPVNPTAAAVSGDFNVTGVFTTVDVVERTARTNALAGVAGGDPYLRRIGDELLIVNRDRGENVTVLGGSPLALIDQYATGGGSNPQDVAVVGGKLYVPALGGAGVVVIDRATRATTTIGFPAIDPDGKPDCVSAFAVGARVYVACGVLDETFTPRGNGKLVVVDSTRDAIELTLELPAPNPIGLVTGSEPSSALGGDLLVATAPSFTDAGTGCLARVRTTGTPAVTGCLVDNADLGAYANRVAVSADGAKVWIAAALYAPDFSSQTGALRAYEVGAGRLGEVVSLADQQLLDVAACPDGRIVAGDSRAGQSGLRVFLDGVEETTAPIGIGRPTGGGNGLVCW
jgi:hypothetical protein